MGKFHIPQSSDERLTQPPEGFSHLLTQEQWNGVVEFSRAVNAPIVTSFATSSGTRDPGGIWTSHLGLRVLDYTRLLGGTIAAAEFMNEPTLAVLGGAPKGYDAEAYGKDFRVFHVFARDKAPEMLILGPGSVGETIATDAHGSIGFIILAICCARAVTTSTLFRIITMAPPLNDVPAPACLRLKHNLRFRKTG